MGIGEFFLSVDGYLIGIIALGITAGIVFGCFRIAEELRKRKDK